jgi:16S rRNA (cytosine967-C5)-methyltransferase
MGSQSHRPEKRTKRSVVLNASNSRNNRTRPAEDISENIPGLAARKTAARLLAAIIDAKTPLDGLTDHQHGHPMFRALDLRDRSLVRAILVSALRHRVTIESLIASRLEKPLPANATALSHILHVAAAQILFLDVPDSAAVDLAVTHAKSDTRTARFAALVNGVLRSIVRGKDAELSDRLAKTDDAPAWFAQRLQAAYGTETTNRILAIHRVEAPVDLTVKSEPENWATQFGGIVLPTGTVRVARLPAHVTALPGFEEGAWWVQDAAASLPARLLGDVAGLHVADLCAAPGGKTAQIALAGARVTAIDSSKNRIVRLRENLGRLGFDVETVQADILTYEPPELFDAILLDAPCSSTGTVRRHPDVPWTKSAADIEKLADLQRRLLDRAVTMVKPGGRIVFSNCSLDPLEGELLFEAFLAQTPGIEPDPVLPGEFPGLDAFITANGTLRTTPADMVMESPAYSGLDGFYAARIRRLK